MNSNAPFWDANLCVLREHFPALADHLAGSKNSDTDLDSITVVTSANGAPGLIINTKHIHSPRDPKREGERLAAGIAAGTGPLVALGFGLGYAVEAAAERFPERPLVVVERRTEILLRALEHRDLGKFLERKKLIFVLGSGDPGSASAVLSALGFFGEARRQAAGEAAEWKPEPRVTERPTLLKNRALVEIDREWYEDAERQIEAWTARDAVNQATQKRFGARWVRNLGANMTAIRDMPGIGGLTGILPPDIPVLLVAAGPSLDRIAARLPLLRERAVIVAVDTSLRFLRDAKTDADFALVVDPQFWNVRHLDRAAAPRTCLVAESAVYPPALRHHAERIWLSGSLFPLGKFIEERVDPKGNLGAGGSVATSAWDFARLLGARSIWIAGLDLAFPGLKTHYKGAAFEERALAQSNRFRPAETLSVHALRDGGPFPAPAADGGRVLTDRRLSLYAAWFENRFRRYPEIENHRFSTGGLAISGLVPSAVEELIALPPRRSAIDPLLRAAFSRVEGAFYAPEARKARAERYAAARAALLAGLAELETLAEKAAAIARGRDQTTETVRAELERIDRRIAESEVKDVAAFLSPPESDLAAEGTRPAGELERHGELSAKSYRALAEAARYQYNRLNRGSLYPEDPKPGSSASF